MKPSFHSWAEDRRLKGLVFLVLAFAAVALVAYTYLSIKQAKNADNIYGPATISVSGKGEVVVVPDVATFIVSVRADAEDSSVAQSDAAEAVGAIIAYLKENGVAEADIKTLNYNLYPRYKDIIRPLSATSSDFDGIEVKTMPAYVGKHDYGINTEEILGFTAEQSVEVKVRDTKKAGELIAGAGTHGATKVSSLVFTVDDDTNAKAEARTKAINDGKGKARQLADTLGVRLVRLSGFYEEEGGYYPMYEEGYGGDMMSEPRMILPEVPTGEHTITSRVNLTYEIR